MHATHAGEKRKPLQKMARRMLRAEAQGLKATARLEYLSVWQMEKIKDTKKGSRAYAYWMATWGAEWCGTSTWAAAEGYRASRRTRWPGG